MLKGTDGGILIDVRDIEKTKEELIFNLEKENFFSKKTDFLLQEKDKSYYKELENLLAKYQHSLYLTSRNKHTIIQDVFPREMTLIKDKIKKGEVVKIEGDVILVGDLDKDVTLQATGSIFVFGKACGKLVAGKEIMILDLQTDSIMIQDVVAVFNLEEFLGIAIKISLDLNKDIVFDEVIIDEKFMSKQITVERN